MIFLSILTAVRSLLEAKVVPEISHLPRAEVVTSCADVRLQAYSGIVKSGYMATGRGKSGLGFIFYGKKNITDVTKLKQFPTIIWLNGGPGSSSQLGNMFELGPIQLKGQNPINKDQFLTVQNNETWASEYNLLFVDNPVGTGLSYADTAHPDAFVTNMSTLSSDFYNALKQLYNNPKGCMNVMGITDKNPLFLFGQSYAGKYVPAIAAYILSRRENATSFLSGFKGIGIGDGFTQPLITLRGLGNFATMFSLVDNMERSKLEQLLINASFQQRNRDWSGLHDSFNLILDRIKGYGGNVNVYDITRHRDYNFDLIKDYFQSKPIRDTFKLNPDIHYDGQKAGVQKALYEDFMKGYSLRVQYCLLKELPVLIYSGQNDMICHTPGMFNWVNRMNFEKQEQFRNSYMQPWKIKGKTVGTKKEVQNLWMRVLYNAGHLVPMDQPGTSLQMLKEFVEKYK